MPRQLAVSTSAVPEAAPVCGCRHIALHSLGHKHTQTVMSPAQTGRSEAPDAALDYKTQLSLHRRGV